MNKKNNKIIIPVLVLVSFVFGCAWTYLVVNQLDRGTVLTGGSLKGSYTIS